MHAAVPECPTSWQSEIVGSVPSSFGWHASTIFPQAASGSGPPVVVGSDDEVVDIVAPVEVDPLEVEVELASASVSAAALDGVVIFALSLIFLVALMTITNVDLARLVFSVGLDMPTKFAFSVLLVSVLLMYVVVVRSFFGRTLGEWTFDLQMGDDQQHEKAIYPLQVLWRSVLVVGTGIFAIPLLSMVLGRDLLAPLTGLQLYRQR